MSSIFLCCGAEALQDSSSDKEVNVVLREPYMELGSASSTALPEALSPYKLHEVAPAPGLSLFNPSLITARLHLRSKVS